MPCGCNRSVMYPNLSRRDLVAVEKYGGSGPEGSCRRQPWAIRRSPVAAKYPKGIPSESPDLLAPLRAMSRQTGYPNGVAPEKARSAVARLHHGTVTSCRMLGPLSAIRLHTVTINGACPRSPHDLQISRLERFTPVRPSERFNTSRFQMPLSLYPGACPLSLRLKTNGSRPGPAADHAS